jgi:hypothetical protein
MQRWPSLIPLLVGSVVFACSTGDTGNSPAIKQPVLAAESPSPYDQKKPWCLPPVPGEPAVTLAPQPDTKVRFSSESKSGLKQPVASPVPAAPKSAAHLVRQAAYFDAANALRAKHGDDVAGYERERAAMKEAMLANR